MSIRFAVLMSCLLTLGACQSAPQTAELRSRNAQLAQQLDEAKAQVEGLQAERRQQREEIREQDRVISILQEERDFRAEESSRLRRDVRAFVQGQIDNLRSFLLRNELLDYIGDELIDRRFHEARPLLLVDLGNPLPRNGSLTGVAAHLEQASSFQVKVLRPAGEDLVVIWESEAIRAEAGFVRQSFPVSVGVQAGDLLAYHFPERAAVSFDKGSGNTRYSRRNPSLGESISRNSLDGEGDQRAYSIGAYGLLNLQ